ncbi:MAG: 3-dehydroquinate synthase [Ruminococcaceae bacterium]|nr:3-dehydroquinate synthase [Oscillospiraceae bacterium]
MKLTAALGPASYDVIIKPGTLARVHRLANLRRRVMVVSDDGVPAKYVKALLQQCDEGHSCILPQGEGGKSIESWQAILARMLDAGFDRHDLVVAVGGGVPGDVAGFAAASYMRGIDWLQVPTTTMAQIDASVGGKTAVNLGGTKNVAGAFHQPRLVVADSNTLKTLPPRHMANGLAEALKTALIGDADLFELMEQKDIAQNLERILYLALRYKIGVVERDATEQGERRLLNFGHTIGHGIEAAGGPQGLLHGECVALGMLPMIESKTLLRRTRAVMRKLGLPLKYTADPDTVLHYMQRDKKREGDRYTIVRVKTLGEGALETVTFDELRLLVKGNGG